MMLLGWLNSNSTFAPFFFVWIIISMDIRVPPIDSIFFSSLIMNLFVDTHKRRWLWIYWIVLVNHSLANALKYKSIERIIRVCVWIYFAYWHLINKRPSKITFSSYEWIFIMKNHLNHAPNAIHDNMRRFKIDSSRQYIQMIFFFFDKVPDKSTTAKKPLHCVNLFLLFNKLSMTWRSLFMNSVILLSSSEKYKICNDVFYKWIFGRFKLDKYLIKNSFFFLSKRSSNKRQKNVK